MCPGNDDWSPGKEENSSSSLASPDSPRDSNLSPADSGYATPQPDYSLDDVMTLKGGETGISSTIALNLQPYIDSHNAKDEKGCKRYREVFSEVIQGAGGSIFWQETLDTAIKTAIKEGRLNTEDAAFIEHSPACEFMKSSFVEIMKNVMDEAILGHYHEGRNAQIEMHLNIDISSPDQITLTISDTGRGFLPTFLAKNATTEGKEAYIKETGSHKAPSADKKLPKLFGGAGLGLRILMAAVMHGAELPGPGQLKPKYEKPAISKVELSNDNGARIQVTTSMTPLTLLQKKSDEHNIAPPPLAAVPLKRKKQVTAAFKDSIQGLRGDEEKPKGPMP